MFVSQKTEVRIQNTEYRILEHWNPGTLEHWNPGTV